MNNSKSASNTILPLEKLKIAKAKGVYLIDEFGNQILDAAAGSLVASIGHGRKRVVDVVAKNLLDKGYVLPLLQHVEREPLIQELRTHWLPEPLTQINFTCGGSEGNDLAIRLALQYQQILGFSKKTKIIGREPSYHGTTFLTLTVGGHAERRRSLESVLEHHPKAQTPYSLRFPTGENTDICDYYVKSVEQAIAQEGADSVAALIAEPITGTSGGALVPPDNYWPRIRKLCDKHGILLIMDEVMTGFGRTGTKFACDHWGLIPDLLVGSKGLAAGYAAISGVYFKPEIMQALQSEKLGIMFYTFAAQPAACAAANEVLKIVREENLIDNVVARGAQLKTKLEASFSNHPNVAEVRGRGLLWAVEIVANRETLEQYPKESNITNRIANAALRRGVLFYRGGTGDVRDVICIGPPYTINETEINHCVEVLSAAINEIVNSEKT